MSCKHGMAGSIPDFSQSVGCDLKPWHCLLRPFKTRTTAGETSGAPGNKNHKTINLPGQYWLYPRSTATKKEKRKKKAFWENKYILLAKVKHVGVPLTNIIRPDASNYFSYKSKEVVSSQKIKFRYSEMCLSTQTNGFSENTLSMQNAKFWCCSQ